MIRRGLFPGVTVAILVLGCTHSPPAPPPPPPPPPAAPPPPAVSAPPAAPPPGPPPAPPPPSEPWPCRPSAVIAGTCAEKDGVDEVEGWVIDVHACQPCPPRSMCKPCEGEYVVLSDDRSPKARPASFTGSDLRVTLPAPPTYRVGQRVKLRVIPGEMMFVGDPCCFPGRYVARLAK